MNGTNPLVDALLAEARSRPNADCLTDDRGRRWSNQDLLERSAQFATALVALGLTPGDRVAVQAAKSIDLIAMHLGALRVGAVYVPLNEQYTARELNLLISDAGARLVVADAPGIDANVVSFDALAAHADASPTEFVDVARRHDDLAAILFTSGTTGRPKGAMLSQANLAASAQALAAVWGFSADDVLLHALPLFHTHGLFVAVHCALISGARMHVLSRFDPDGVLAAMPKCSVFMGVPTHYTRLLADPGLNAEVVKEVRLFTSGSAPMLAATHEEFSKRTGHHIVERYGMTETCILTSNPLAGPCRPGTVGLPLPGIELRIVEMADAEAGNEAAGVGSIQVRGASVFDGYWGRPELQASEFSTDGWFITGDLGRYDAAGYVEIVGRAKDLIITGGLNVYPKEVEAVLDQLPGVLESAVFGLADADFGERVVAAVVAAPGHVLDDVELRSQAKVELAGFKVPKHVLVLEALPRNAMGKVEKNVLRQQAADALS